MNHQKESFRKRINLCSLPISTRQEEYLQEIKKEPVDPPRQSERNKMIGLSPNR